MPASARLDFRGFFLLASYLLLCLVMVIFSSSRVQAVIPGQEELDSSSVLMMVHCASMIVKANEEMKLSDQEAVNRVAGFRTNVLKTTAASEWIKVREEWTRHHERAHCLDRDLVLGSDSSEYRLHLSEAYADGFASLMVYKNTGNLKALQEAANLRAASQLVLPVAGFPDDRRWARYFTHPTIERVLRWTSENEGALDGLDEDEVFALAVTLADEVRVSEEVYERRVDLLADTQLIASGQGREPYLIKWHPDLSVEEAVRIELALLKIGIGNLHLLRYQKAQKREAA